MKRPSSSSAFTLIELLVVIAIIALLAGIALPVFGRVQERARATKDANNLAQLGKAMIMYFGDNNDVMFEKNPAAPVEGAPTSWPLILTQGNYMPDFKIFQSPFDRRDSTTSGSGATLVFKDSYGVNQQAWSTPEIPGLSKWTSPSRTMLIAPNPSADASLPTSWLSLSTSQPERPTPTGTAPLGTHNNKLSINALYGDSHVETMTWTTFSSLTSSSGGGQNILWYPTATN